MAAIDYTFKSEGKKLFLSKKLQNSDKLSKDSREITPNEIVALFSFYFQNYCVENQTDGMEIIIDGKKLFEVKLCDPNSEQK